MLFFFFFNDTATTEIYTLSLHDALPISNQIIKKALHPSPADVVIVTKVGARRGEDRSWLHALSRRELIEGVHDNLRNLGVDRLEVVKLRVGGVMEASEGLIGGPLTGVAGLERQGRNR